MRLFPTRVESAIYLLATSYLLDDRDQAYEILRAILDSGARDLYLVMTLPGERRFAADPDVQAIIGPRGLNLLERILGGEVTEVEVAIEDRQALFRAGPALIVSRLIDGTFPSLDGVIPAKSDHAFTSTAGDFASGLRRASLLTTRDAMSVELRIEPSSLVIRSRAREVGEAKVEVPVDYDGAPQTVGFNPSYLQDALKVMEPGSMVTFEFTNAKSPGKLSDCDEYTYVVMPIALE